MKYRNTLLLAEKALTGSGTETIDINVVDPVSRIFMSWRVSKSQDGMSSYAHADITKIELVDGSDVLHSLDGGQNQALCIYDRKCQTMNHGQAITGNSQFATFGIDFGRFLFDPVLAFDPKRFRNPQLKVSYDVDVSDDGVTTGYLEVWAECFDEKIITPSGFLSAKEVYAYTCAAENSYEYIDLPTDNVLRKLLIQGWRNSYEPWNVIKEARLREDNGKREPFDWELEPYARVMKGVYTPVEEMLVGKATTAGAYYFYITPTDYYPNVGLNAWGDDYIYLEGVRAGGKIRPYSKNATRQFQGIVRGYFPNHCFEFPFGDPQDLNDWYDVTGIGNLRLRLKAGGSGTSGEGKVITQQLRRY